MRIIWIALSFVAACTGIILGTSLRNRQETGSGLFSSSELLAMRRGGNASDNAPWFPATAYYDQIRRILASEYVEPGLNETEMARGSLDYMLRSLGDPETRYYEPEQWSAYLGRLSGEYRGIGADVLAQEAMTDSTFSLPVRIISVARGGPADVAGLRSGDVIESINGRWVASKSLLAELQKASDAYADKKITRAQYDEKWKRIRAQSEKMMPVDEAVETLQTGQGLVKVEIKRDGELLKFDVKRADYKVEPVETNGDTIRINVFAPGSAKEILDALESRSSATIDLRGNIGGAIGEVEKSLQGIAGTGIFAQIKMDPKGPLEKLKLRGSKEATAPKLTVLVDSGTAREAEVFATALRDLAGATISGGPMAGLARKIERYSLPDGSGYCITAGHYFDLKGVSLVREDAAAKKAREAAEASQ